MCDTIKNLYNGRLDPSSEQLPPDTERHGFIKNMDEFEEKAKEILNAEQLEFFNEYVKLRNDYGYHMHEEIFTQGFKLGAKITMETFK